MKDILNRLQKMRDDAEDCALISRLATDPTSARHSPGSQKTTER